jgi:hypothetical protein
VFDENILHADMDSDVGMMRQESSMDHAALLLCAGHRRQRHSCVDEMSNDRRTGRKKEAKRTSGVELPPERAIAW